MGIGMSMKFVDMHCDTISRLYENEKKGETERLISNSGHVDLDKLKRGKALLQNFALFVDGGSVDNPFEEAVRMADLYYRELEDNKEVIAPVLSWRDIEKNKEAGKISALLTVEEGAVCRGDVAVLRMLYRLGVRMMTLTWNYENEIGHPNLKSGQYGKISEDGEPFYRIADKENGLTQKGIEIVEEMERIGMIIDVSHLSDAGFYDVWKYTKRPFVASHSNARAMCPWVRNLTDDMIRKIASRGGVIGLNFCPDFLTEGHLGSKDGITNPGTIASIVQHAKYITDIGGIECLGLGSDFDGIDTHEELPDYSYMPHLEEAFIKAGFLSSEVEKICSGNVLRLYKEIL